MIDCKVTNYRGNMLGAGFKVVNLSHKCLNNDFLTWFVNMYIMFVSIPLTQNPIRVLGLRALDR